ncbi:MAG: hypothetical protein ACE15E_03630 [Acidobacteriota bacterium]
MALVSLTLQNGNKASDARNLEICRDLCKEAKELGMPVIGEYFPADAENLGPDELHERVYRGGRIIAELGADLIKTFYTKDFRSVTRSCPIPVLGLGASRLPTQLKALELAAREVEDGAAGVVFGPQRDPGPGSPGLPASLMRRGQARGPARRGSQEVRTEGQPGVKCATGAEGGEKSHARTRNAFLNTPASPAL